MQCRGEYIPSHNLHPKFKPLPPSFGWSARTEDLARYYRAFPITRHPLGICKSVESTVCHVPWFVRIRRSICGFHKLTLKANAILLLDVGLSGKPCTPLREWVWGKGSADCLLCATDFTRSHFRKRFSICRWSEDGSASLQISHPLHATDVSPGANELFILYVGFPIQKGRFVYLDNL